MSNSTACSFAFYAAFTMHRFSETVQCIHLYLNNTTTGNRIDGHLYINQKYMFDNNI